MFQDVMYVFIDGAVYDWPLSHYLYRKGSNLNTVGDGDSDGDLDDIDFGQLEESVKAIQA